MIGFFVAILISLLIVALWAVAKTKLERWANDLNRETHNQLREAQRKLDAIAHGQDRLLLQMEHVAETQRATASDLRVRLAGSRTGS